MDITFNIDELTLGQVEFLEEFSRLTLEAILKYAEGKVAPPFRLTMAMIAIGLDAEDPSGKGLEQARQYKLKDVVIGE